MEKKPFNIILLGDPASGKGTQAIRLVKEYGLYNLDMGREVRKPSARKLFDYSKTTAIGKLTPTAVARDIFIRIIAKVPEKQGILFNGNPKMINEAKLVKRLLEERQRSNPIVIYITLPEKEMILRATKRMREDDALHALKNRRKYYKDQISQVVIFFKKYYTMKTISGMGSEEAVARKIDAVIKQHIKTHGA